MIPFRNTIKHPVKNKKGFTLLELMVVIGLISILASLAIANFIPLKRKAFDSTARSDARNIVESVVMASLDDQDIDYNKVIADGGAVGDIDTGGVSRTPVFVLSSGVIATVSGDSVQGPNSDTTIVSATVSHINGTRAYTCFVHEGTGATILP